MTIKELGKNIFCQRLIKDTWTYSNKKTIAKQVKRFLLRVIFEFQDFKIILK
jgi:hypothetical protein